MKEKIFGFVIILLFIHGISCSESKNNKIYGSWKTKHVEIDLKDVDKILMERGLSVAYATTYQFNEDNTFVIYINENEINGDIQIKYTGKMKLENNSLELLTDTIYARKTGEDWKINAYNETNKYTIKNISGDQLLLTEKVDDNGFLYFDLEREEHISN